MKTRVLPVRLFVLCCLCSLFSPTARSQSISAANGKIELGLGIGPSFFLGDLGGNRGAGTTFIKDVNLPVTKLIKGFYVNFYPAEWLGFRLSANLGELEGFDSLIKSTGKVEMDRRRRNLGFKSSLSEVYVAAEIYPTVFLEQYDGLAHKLRPYGLAGVGMFHFNPKGQYYDASGNMSWVELQPLHLEGQGFPEFPNRKNYSLTQKEIVMGGGFKYYVKENMYVGFEILHRKTFTDYIDDVSTDYIDPYLFDVHLSPEKAQQARQLAYREAFYNPSVNRPYINEQRGNPNQNDAFFSGILRLGWRINGANSPSGLAKRQLKCPVFY